MSGRQIFAMFAVLMTTIVMLGRPDVLTGFGSKIVQYYLGDLNHVAKTKAGTFPSSLLGDDVVSEQLLPGLRLAPTGARSLEIEERTGDAKASE